MTRAALYMRVSSDEQKENQSIESQRVALTAYCQKEGYKIVAQFADDGVSGAIPLDKREGGKKLLKASAKGEFEILLFWRLNRISRGGVRVTLNALDDLVKRKIRLISLHEEVDTGTAIGEMLISLYAFTGRIERDAISANVTAGHIRSAKQQKWQGGMTPFGFQVGADKRLELHPEQSKIVRGIFSDYAAGLSTTTIARNLNQSGIPHPMEWIQNGRSKGTNNRKWTCATISHLLRQERFTGVYQYAKGKNIEEDGVFVRREKKPHEARITYTVPAIVTKEEFETVQMMLATSNFRLKKSPDSIKRSYLLAGLIYCSDCGGRYGGFAKHHRTKGGEVRQYAYYVCRNGNTGSNDIKCSNEPIGADVLENNVKLNIISLLGNPEQVVASLNARRERAMEQLVEQQKQARNLETELDQVKSRQQTLINLVSRGLVGEEDIAGELGTLKKQRDKLSADLITLNQIIASNDPAHIVRRLSRTLERIPAFAKSTLPTEEEWRDLLIDVVDNIKILRKQGAGARNLQIQFNLDPTPEEEVLLNEFTASCDNGSPLSNWKLRTTKSPCTGAG